MPLLTRTTRSVGLTEAGERFLEHALPAFAGLTAAFEAARSFGERPAGLLRLNVPRAAIPFLIEPVIEGFAAAFPDVEVEICGEDELIDLVERGFDAGIRMGDYLEADMIGIRLTPPFRLVVAGSPDYFAAPRPAARFPPTCAGIAASAPGRRAPGRSSAGISTSPASRSRSPSTGR